jgi:hypothetical protein
MAVTAVAQWRRPSAETNRSTSPLPLGAEFENFTRTFSVASIVGILCSSAFRPTPGGTLSAPSSSLASAWASMKASFACLGACSKSCSLRPPRLNERCLEAYHLHRTRLELIAERKVRRRQLTDDGNVEISGRDLREREVRAHYRRPIGDRRERRLWCTTMSIRKIVDIPMG